MTVENSMEEIHTKEEWWKIANGAAEIIAAFQIAACGGDSVFAPELIDVHNAWKRLDSAVIVLGVNSQDSIMIRSELLTKHRNSQGGISWVVTTEMMMYGVLDRE